MTRDKTTQDRTTRPKTIRDNKAAMIGLVGVVAAAAIGALIAGVFALFESDKGSGDTVNNSPCGVIKGSQINCNNPQGEPLPTTNQAPTGTGPWPFRTVNTWGESGVDMGAVVRPCKEQDCGCDPTVKCRLGVAKGNTTVYARCLAHSDFTGVPGEVQDTVWFKIAWPNNKLKATQVFAPTAHDQYSGWVKGSTLEPEGHNGNIPVCPAEPRVEPFN
ncbi:hypothetical protein [Micromonospora sp. NPDC005172]|uniref:hypothetical protein n=1 Tax=Micromonospora sp. NPDC005172 TaxID=3156867 RepID=UPI00339F600D